MKFDNKKYLRPWMNHPTLGQYILVRMTFAGLEVGDLKSHNGGWCNGMNWHKDLESAKKEVDEHLADSGYLFIKDIFESVV